MTRWALVGLAGAAAHSGQPLVPLSDVPAGTAADVLDPLKPRRVVVVSPGTTGTHAVYHLLCNMGLATVHWDNACDTGESCFAAKAHLAASRASLATVSDRQGPDGAVHTSGQQPLGLAGLRGENSSVFGADIGSAETPAEYVWDYDRSRLIWSEHSRMQTLSDELSSCAENKPGECHTTLVEWMGNVTSAVAAVEKQDFSMTDTPYPGLFHLFTSQAFGASFIFANRNATKWAEVRVGDHGGGDPICLKNGTRNWANGTAGELSSPFDLWGCAAECNSTGIVTIADCFTRIDRVNLSTAAAAFEALEKDVKRSVGDRLLTLEVVPDNGPHLTVGEMLEPVSGFLKEHGVDMPCADASVLNSAQAPFDLQQDRSRLVRVANGDHDING